MKTFSACLPVLRAVGTTNTSALKVALVEQVVTHRPAYVSEERERPQFWMTLNFSGRGVVVVFYILLVLTCKYMSCFIVVLGLP